MTEEEEAEAIAIGFQHGIGSMAEEEKHLDCKMVLAVPKQKSQEARVCQKEAQCGNKSEDE